MKYIPILLLLFLGHWANAQIDFQNISFKEALKKAHKEGKLLFIQFEASDCSQCNEVGDKGLSDAAVSKRIKEAFIPLKITTDHPERKYIGQQYNISTGFGSLFINQDGTLIHAFQQTSSFPTHYQQQIDIAIEKAGETLKVAELEAEYKKGNKSPGFLEALLLKKQSLNLSTEELLDEYVSTLPADSFQSARTLQFIAQMAPCINSQADNALRQSPMNFNKAWYLMDLNTRITLNNRIIYKSINIAIKNHDEAYANQVARFAQSTYSGSPAGIKVYDKNMLQFYEETSDTTNYFKNAIAYYDRYYMALNVDSIKRIDTINRERIAKTAKRDTIRNGNTIQVRSNITYRPITQNYMLELNAGAWNFYKMTSNTSLLSVATEWAAKAVSFFESPEVLHTYACLLYKQGQKQKALTTMSSAIELKKGRGFPTKEWDDILNQMKKDLPIN